MRPLSVSAAGHRTRHAHLGWAPSCLCSWLGQTARPGKAFTALLSISSPTAFWGESDDSSSELEAALRPQTHGVDSDDFDDFYD